MLTLEGLEITYAGGFELRANFVIDPGALVAVIGPSGAGKSTLLAVIAGFFAPARGRVLWQGRDITDTPPGARPISMIFQDNNLFPHLSAAQNVALGLRPDMRLARADWAAVDAALARVGLAGLGARKPGALSGGQQSRVALARMLLQRRPLVLLDEPFAALGPALRAEMLDLVAALCAETGAMMLMVSHDISDAQRIAGQIIWLDAGMAHPPMPTAALLADPPAGLRAYLGP